MEYQDKFKQVVKDGSTILFSLEDSVEPSGFNKVVSSVKLCFWSNIEKRYIPFSENYNGSNLDDLEVIKNDLKN